VPGDRLSLWSNLDYVVGAYGYRSLIREGKRGAPAYVCGPKMERVIANKMVRREMRMGGGEVLPEKMVREIPRVKE
jgi:hypothetical protein